MSVWEVRNDPILSSILVLRCDHRCPGLGVDGGAVMLINERDVTILTMVAQGKTSLEIAKILGITQPMVSKRLVHLNKELGGDLLVKDGIRAPYTINPYRMPEVVPVLMDLDLFFKELRSC